MSIKHFPTWQLSDNTFMCLVESRSDGRDFSLQTLYDAVGIHIGKRSRRLRFDCGNTDAAAGSLGYRGEKKLSVVFRHLA
jgi:hypothetical protein